MIWSPISDLDKIPEDKLLFFLFYCSMTEHDCESIGAVGKRIKLSDLNIEGLKKGYTHFSIIEVPE